jgi:ribosomal protein S27AE/heme/copper-type cytochrome/quinol oxidase subunit 4
VKNVSNCPRCGEKVTEEMTFCPKCGASLRTAQPQAEARTTTYRRNEKEEKEEKGEKREKHEKRQYSFVGPLIGGLILIFIGLTSYLKITGYVEESGLVLALFFVVIGLLIVVGGIYAAMIAGRRHPKP